MVVGFSVPCLVCCEKVYCLSKYDNSLFVIINKYYQALMEDKVGKKKKKRDSSLNKFKSQHHCKYKQITSRMSSKLAVSENIHNHTHPYRPQPSGRTMEILRVGRVQTEKHLLWEELDVFLGQHNNSNGYLSLSSW